MLNESEAGASQLGAADVSSEALARRSTVRWRMGDESAARKSAEESLSAAGGNVAAAVAARIALALCTRDAGLAARAAEEARGSRLRYQEVEALLVVSEIRALSGEPGASRIAASEAAKIARSHAMAGLLQRAEVMRVGAKR